MLLSACSGHREMGDDDSEGCSEGDEPEAGSNVVLVGHVDSVGLVVDDGGDERGLGEGVAEEPCG